MSSSSVLSKLNCIQRQIRPKIYGDPCWIQKIAAKSDTMALMVKWGGKNNADYKKEECLFGQNCNLQLLVFLCRANWPNLYYDTCLLLRNRDLTPYNKSLKSSSSVLRAVVIAVLEANPPKKYMRQIKGSPAGKANCCQVQHNCFNHVIWKQKQC